VFEIRAHGSRKSAVDRFTDAAERGSSDLGRDL
jgi:hypothetical protein